MKERKVPMEKSSGDLGTKESENALKKTSAGKMGSMCDALGHEPKMGKAVSYIESNHGYKKMSRGKMEDMDEKE